MKNNLFLRIIKKLLEIRIEIFTKLLLGEHYLPKSKYSTKISPRMDRNNLIYHKKIKIKSFNEPYIIKSYKEES